MRDARFEELTDPECRKLLAERHLGRLALVDAEGPVIFPINYVFDQDSVVFRTDPEPSSTPPRTSQRLRSRSTRPTRRPGPAGA